MLLLHKGLNERGGRKGRKVKKKKVYLITKSPSLPVSDKTLMQSTDTYTYQTLYVCLSVACFPIDGIDTKSVLAVYITINYNN